MISTSILYCNKLDALPLTHSDYKTSDSVCSNSITNSVNTSGGRFRVRYLGSNACNLKNHKIDDGISAFQKSLLDLYCTTRRRSIALRSFYPFTLNQVVDVCSYGVVVAERDPTIIRINQNQVETVVTKVITPLSNILLWAAVRFNSRVSRKRRVFGAAFVPLSCSDAVLNKNSFIALSSKQRFLVGLPHPPLFVCVLQKVSNPRELECHLLVCASNEDAISLCALLGDTQKHCSKIGALELPLPGHMGKYSYQSSSRMSRSTNDCNVRSVTVDTQSDSSRVGGKSVSLSSYRSRFTPTTHKSQFKFRPLEQDLHQPTFRRKTQFEDIHGNNLSRISNDNNSEALQSRDYRLQSYRFPDNSQTPRATPTTSSSSEKQIHCNQQRFQSRNNNKNGLIGKRDSRKVCCNCNNDNNISIINNNGIKYTPKNSKRFSNNYNNSDIFGKMIRDERKLTYVDSKCGPSSDSGEPKLGTKAITMKSSNAMCHKGSPNYHFNNSHNSSPNQIINSTFVTEKSNARNYGLNNKNKNYVKNNEKSSEINRNSLYRKQSKQNFNQDSSHESSSNSEITLNDNVKRILNAKQVNHCNNKVNTNIASAVKSIKSPIRRYFGDTLRGAKSFEPINHSNDSSSSDDTRSQPKYLVRVRNATTSCRDAPWIVNKNNQSMTVSKTLFLGSESDSKKSSSLSHISNDSLRKTKSTKSTPELIGRDHQFGCSADNVSHPNTSNHFKHIHSNTRLNPSSNGNNKVIYLPEIKCIKSFNSRTDVKQWSTLSLSSNFEPNITRDKSAPKSRPDLTYKTALPVVEHESLAENVPRFTRLKSNDYSNSNRSTILSRLRRMSLRSWFGARSGTTRFLTRFRSKRRNRKRCSHPSNDSAIHIDNNGYKSESNNFSLTHRDNEGLGRKHSWSFHDFTLRNQKHIRDSKPTFLNLDCGTPSQLSDDNNLVSDLRIFEKKTNNDEISQRNREHITQIQVHRPDRDVHQQQTNDSTGQTQPGNSMSSDSGLEEVDCLSSTDITNSLCSRQKHHQISSAQNCKSNKTFEHPIETNHINMMSDKRDFRNWSKTNLHQELGYIP